MSDYKYSFAPLSQDEETILHIDKCVNLSRKRISAASSIKSESQNDKDEYIEQLEKKIFEQQNLIAKQKKSIKQLTNTYCEFNDILTRLWNKSAAIGIIKSREEIKEILNIWYKNEWQDIW